MSANISCTASFRPRAPTSVVLVLSAFSVCGSASSPDRHGFQIIGLALAILRCALHCLVATLDGATLGHETAATSTRARMSSSSEDSLEDHTSRKKALPRVIRTTGGIKDDWRSGECQGRGYGRGVVGKSVWLNISDT